MGSNYRRYIDGSSHHVYNRGIEGNIIFYSHWDCILYLTLYYLLGKQYGITTWAFCIMPNHVHMILVLQDGFDQLPTISRVVQQTKGLISKRVGQRIWQVHFHEHVIRGEQDYREIWEYIEQNPKRWMLDRYYCE